MIWVQSALFSNPKLAKGYFENYKSKKKLFMFEVDTAALLAVNKVIENASGSSIPHVVRDV